MELTWFGTAGFRIKTDKHTMLIDPYVSRNDKAFPRQPLKPSDIQDADATLISHGHFDHNPNRTQIRCSTSAQSGYSQSPG